MKLGQLSMSAILELKVIILFKFEFFFNFFFTKIGMYRFRFIT